MSLALGAEFIGPQYRRCGIDIFFSAASPRFELFRSLDSNRTISETPKTGHTCQSHIITIGGFVVPGMLYVRGTNISAAQVTGWCLQHRQWRLSLETRISQWSFLGNTCLSWYQGTVYMMFSTLKITCRKILPPLQMTLPLS